MFAINASIKSASSDSISSMSSMSLSHSLEYFPPNKCPSPKPTTIVFGTADTVKPLNFSKKLEDGELEDEDKPIINSPVFTMQRPAQIHIKVEDFSDAHLYREVESINQTTDDSADTTDSAADISRVLRAGGSPSHVSQQLALLWRSLNSVYRVQQPKCHRHLGQG